MNPKNIVKLRRTAGILPLKVSTSLKEGFDPLDALFPAYRFSR
jgi:hypothetical protein